MDNTLFFDGRLRKAALPVFHGPPPPTAAGPKRLLLGQGELANFYDNSQGVRYLASLELKLGAIRANHLHRVKLEHVYVITGRLLVVATSGAKVEPVSIELNTGELITIEPGIAHGFKTLEAGYAIEFSPNLFDPSDVEKCVLI
jgi:hypothetical protein